VKQKLFIGVVIKNQLEEKMENTINERITALDLKYENKFNVKTLALPALHSVRV